MAFLATMTQHYERVNEILLPNFKKNKYWRFMFEFIFNGSINFLFKKQ